MSIVWKDVMCQLTDCLVSSRVRLSLASLVAHMLRLLAGCLVGTITKVMLHVWHLGIFTFLVGIATVNGVCCLQQWCCDKGGR